jgi:hypothetical protein
MKTAAPCAGGGEKIDAGRAGDKKRQEKRTQLEFSAAGQEKRTQLEFSAAELGWVTKRR